jgi:TatD DNase family protein
MELFDSHAHVDGPDFEADLPAVLARAQAAGVRRLVCIGSGPDVATAERSVALATAHGPGSPVEIWATIGIHPHDVATMTEATWSRMAELARAPRVVAVGETGLDYHYDLSPRPVQQAAFERFLDLARSAGQPVCCHIRDAHEDARAILAAGRAAELGCVIHCFTGTPADAEAYVAMGISISFSGIVTFKTAADLRAAAKLVPADRLLVETDCPFLAPLPHRGKRNEPAYLRHTVELLAELRGMPADELARLTGDNAARLYRLPSAGKA